ncbi:MAG: glycosyltransferase family 4 protein [Gemmatimonadaceae bacterium]
MRVLFYLGTKEWSATARVLVTAAGGLAGRGHAITIACCEGTRLERASRDAGLETILIGGTFFGTGGAWDLRKVLQAKFIEAAVVTSDADHRTVASAMRLAGRGSVLRRLQAFEPFDRETASKLSLKLAPSGLLVSSQAQAGDARPKGWAIPTTVARLGVDAAAYEGGDTVLRGDIGAPPQGPLIVCAYDLSGRNRIASVVRALALLAPRHPGLHAAVFGPGSDDDELQMHASALGVGRMMSFLGERDDATRVMRGADAGWVLSSLDDGAFAFLDFMALGVPVVADRSPLSEEYVVDGTTGGLLPDDDTAQVASTIAILLADADKRASMGAAGRERVQREFSEAAMIDGFERAVSVAGDRSTWPKS